jgi:hypothetical protein
MRCWQWTTAECDQQLQGALVFSIFVAAFQRTCSIEEEERALKDADKLKSLSL